MTYQIDVNTLSFFFFFLRRVIILSLSDIVYPLHLGDSCHKSLTKRILTMWSMLLNTFFSSSKLDFINQILRLKGWIF